jgi:hypothetical protein
MRDIIASVRHGEKVGSVDIFGKPGKLPCRNHPEYRAFLRGMLANTVETYEIDGFQRGSEKEGPLSYLLLYGEVPYCFCVHCQARGRKEGIHPKRARLGFEKLYHFVSSLIHGDTPPAEGIFPVLLRHFFRWPEILKWENMYRKSLEEVVQELYQTAKDLKPKVGFGRHLDHVSPFATIRVNTCAKADWVRWDAAASEPGARACCGLGSSGRHQ